ncbi:MAG: hypothetical protein K6E50_04545 [Lachnospiraceae bacterium]|nr:hypothetical protein [Lachnospiraceae bacterium]
MEEKPIGVRRMLLVDERNQEKFERYIRSYVPMRTEVYLKFMGITDIKEMPEDDEWMYVSSAGIFAERDVAIVAHTYELASVDYINTKNEKVTVDMTEAYGIEIKISQLDELLDNIVLL